MKKINAILPVLLALPAFMPLHSQNSPNGQIADYMRSSLYTIILDDQGLMNEQKAAIIKKTFFEAPLPEKFNDHNLPTEFRSFSPVAYSVTQEEIDACLVNQKKKKSAFGGLVKSLASGATGGLVDTTDTQKLPAKFLKYFSEKHIANKIVGKWYAESSNASPHFNMSLVKARGLYNATEFDKALAENSARGINLLADAGENLISNTFVVGIRFNYVSKEELAKQVSQTSGILNSFLGGATSSLVNTVVQTGASIAGKGYVIKATAFLFQLDWTPDASNAFYTKYYGAKDLGEFQNSTEFKLKYVGTASEWADLQSTIFTKASEEELVERAAIRSVDEVIAKLQKNFDVFRTKTPVLSITPEITAAIGMKEGVEAGDKFEVLEKIVDPVTSITSYKRVGVIKASKGKIWDNRYGADEEQVELAKAGKSEMTLVKATSFSGNIKNIYPGMLIRQID